MEDESRPLRRHLKHFNLLEKVVEAVQPVANHRLAAALVHKNSIISIGINKKKTHPFMRDYGKNDEAIYLHAEIDCIVNALRHVSADDISKYSLYVLRAKKNGNGMAKPCEGCQRAIAQFGIKDVYYTTDEGFNYL